MLTNGLNNKITFQEVESKVKIVFKMFRILGGLIMFAGFGYTLYIFQQDMSKWSNMDTLATAITVGIGLEVVGILGEFLYNGMSRKRIQKNGVDTVGKIISARQTGTYVNEQPEIELTLSYKVNGKDMTGVTKSIISLLDLSKITEGTELVIKYLPDEPEKIVIKK